MAEHRQPSSEPTDGERGYAHMPALVAQAFSVSRSEARRCINQGALGLDERQILDFDLPRELVDGKELRLGRRRRTTVNLDGQDG
jgi:hypothetical protein